MLPVQLSSASIPESALSPGLISYPKGVYTIHLRRSPCIEVFLRAEIYGLTDPQGSESRKGGDPGHQQKWMPPAGGFEDASREKSLASVSYSMDGGPVPDPREGHAL